MRKRLIVGSILSVAIILLGCAGTFVFKICTTPRFYVDINWYALHLPLWVIIVGVAGLTVTFLGGIVLLGAIIADNINH
jgi:uncharacterized membrane protein (UPF0182 family)